MHPTLFELGPIPIRSYGFMMMVGFLVSIHLAARRAKRCGADDEFVLNLGLTGLIAGVLGARAFYILHRLPIYLHAKNPVLAILNITAGGLEFYGGFLLAVAAVVLYIRLKKRSIRWYLDILAPAIMLGLAFGRIGCFLNGCCWGAPTQVPWAITFPYGSLPFEHQWQQTHEVKVPAEFIVITPGGRPFLIDRETFAMSDEEFQAGLEKLASSPGSAKAGIYGMINGHLQRYNITLEDLRTLAEKLHLQSVPIHPTQLYSCLNALLISIVLGIYFQHRRRHGLVIAWLFVVYPISRFVLEAIRADNPHDTFGLTVSQAFSIAAVPIAMLMIWYLYRLPEVSPRVASELQTRTKAANTTRRRD